MGYSDQKSWMSKALVMIAVLTLATGCLTDDTGTTEPGQGVGSIAMSISPTSATIAQGGSQIVTGTLTRSGTFNGAVTLSMTGVPTGVTAAVTNVVTSGRVTTATITVQVGATTTPGAYNLVAVAKGSGVSDATATFALTVTGASGFTFALSSAAVTIPPGGSSPITINLARTGFTGAITLALEGAPTGVTGVFNPNPATGTSSTLTISVGPGVAAGTYPLTVRASAAGLTDQTATISLTVSASTYTLTLSTNALTVAPGGNSAITVNLNRTNFTGDVALALEGAPTGVTGAFNPTPVTGAASTLTISVAAGTAAGTHTLTVRGTAAGQADRTATITLTIGSAASYTLSLNPAAVSVIQGGTGTTTVDVARSNFTGDVTLSLGGAPAGVTGAFSPNPATGNSSVLTLTVPGSVAAGVYNLTVDGTSSAGSRSTPLTLTVTAAADYSLSLTPPTLTVAQGASGTSTVNITRTSFTGDVTLSLGGAPANVTGVFNPNPTTGNTSALTVTVAGSVTPGVYNLTVNGASSAGSRSTPLTLTVTAAADYSLSLTPPALTVAQGATGSSTVNVTRTNFTGDVSLSLGGAPANVTGVFNPNPATGTSSVLTVTVGSSVAPGTYNLTVDGTGTPGSRSTALALTVTATAAADYSLSSTPVSIAQGGSGTSTITISRTNFTGDVSLSLSGLPAGVTGSFNPNPTSGNTSALTLTVAASVAPGTYTLTVNGAGTPGSRSTTVTLTVTGTGGSGNVSLNFATCPLSIRPVWAAFQDGNGPWTRVTGSGDVYTFNITSGRYGFAYVVLPAAGSSEVHVEYYTTAEQSGNVNRCGTGTLTGKTINGAVAGVDATQQAQIALDGGAVSVSSILTPTFPNFQIKDVANGTFDLIGYRGPFPFGNTTSDRAFIRRDQNIPDGGSVGTLDFNVGTESFAVASATITIGGLAGGETLSAGMNYLTAACTGTSALLYFLQNPGSSFTATGIPAAQQRASDFHSIFVSANTSTTSRFVTELFHTLGARTISLGADLPLPAITQLSAPYKRLQAVYTLPSGYNLSATFSYDDNAGKSVIITATFAYLGGPAVTLALPDFTAVSGWDNTWPPASGSTVDWIVSGVGSTGTACTEGARTIFASRTGSFTVR
ncbi:MAG: hypothetical protein H7Z74_11600 [Anaerolineae bacterium]|nr:hypothetical protein [Gemmatimonadaceae bacterium]